MNALRRLFVAGVYLFGILPVMLVSMLLVLLLLLPVWVVTGDFWLESDWDAVSVLRPLCCMIDWANQRLP